jgi:hypothetical protein
MQKISCYLYSNRIPVIFDLTTITAEWRIVYQRTIKIYKGLDNVLEFEFKNSDQKRQLLTGSNFKFTLMDQFRQEVFQTNLNTNTGIKGVATVTIPSTALINLEHQLMHYSLYKINNNGTNTPIYSDTYYGSGGTVDFIDNVIPKALSPIVIDTFLTIDLIEPLPITADKFSSEVVDISPRNTIEESQSMSLEFRLNALEADIIVQVTEDYMTDQETNWIELDQFSVTATQDLISNTYNLAQYSNNLKWVRIRYNRVLTNTGNIDKVLVRL